MAPQDGSSSNQGAEMDDCSLVFGKHLSEPPPGEEVVISGAAGSFPNSDNFYQLRDNLLGHIDMVSDDERRWKKEHPMVPQRTGKVNNLSKFDAAFFGMHHKQAHAMDPGLRVMLERTYEAIIDAGLNPASLRGSKTGVYVGTCFSESEKTWFFDKLEDHGFAITGCSRSMFAARISYWLGVTGPSYITDSACSSSLYAVDQAYRDIRQGVVDQAVVAAYNLCLDASVSLQFSYLGVLSPDGRCKCFDQAADGYARAEAIGVLFLQKAKNAKRVYATLIHSKTNCDGYKDQGITYPSGEMQARLLSEFYAECGVDPASLAYLEAHGTGTRVGDPEELNAIDKVFCEGRDSPLPIGSGKSNYGHSEPASGMCAIAKVLLAMEVGIIPANLNYQNPRDGVPALRNGKLKVVTENLPFDGGLVGVNSFGFGGANGHVLLRSNQKSKIRDGAPLDSLPRLVVASGRTREAVEAILDDVESRVIDAEFISLLHDIHAVNTPGHLYRGYTLLGSNDRKHRDVQHLAGTNQPIWFVFSGTDCLWTGMGRSLLHIPAFSGAIERCHRVLSSRDIDVLQIITSEDPRVLDNLLNCRVALAAIQVGLVDVLSLACITPDGFVGHSAGEVICAYVDGSLTIEQVMLVAYYQGVALLESSSPITARLTLIKNLQQVIPNPKARSSKWISSSVPEVLWSSPQTMLSSAEYHANSLIGEVLFEEASRLIPEDAITIEIAPRSILQDDLARIRDRSAVNGALVPEAFQDSTEMLFVSLGKLYEAGLQPQLANLYPAVQYPVSRATPMISPLVRWEHSEDWYLTSANNKAAERAAERQVTIRIKDKSSEYYTGHVIDGRNLFPATGYLLLVWETSRLMNGLTHLGAVVFEDVRFHRATNLHKEASVDFIISVQRGSGRFEVVESGAAIVTGYVREPADVESEALVLDLPVVPQGEDYVELSARDIYKELRLRGYNYTDLFRSLISVDNTATRGQVRWHDNWVAFMDNLLQMRILPRDTRALYVPTGIGKLVINMDKHFAALQACGGDKVLPAYAWHNVDVIRSGGVEIHRLHASPITRRKAFGEPVLESYRFVPHCAASSQLPGLHQVLRMCVHLALENQLGVKVKAVEVLDSESDSQVVILAPELLDILGDLPLIQAEMLVYTEGASNPRTTDLGPQIQVLQQRLVPDAGFLLVMASNVLGRHEMLRAATSALAESGCIIARERPGDAELIPDLGLEVVVDQTLEGGERIVMLRKKEESSSLRVVHITEKSYSWLPELQAALKDAKPKTRVVLVAQQQPLSGMLGLFNCLRKEPGGDIARCFFVMDKNAPGFDPSLELYSQQLAKDLAVNILKNGQWGSYRHLPLEAPSPVETLHAYNNVTVRGDLASLTWLEGPLQPGDPGVAHVYYSALNFRDIMTSTGKLALDAVSSSRTTQDIVQGFEFSGRDSSGRRVMGMLQAGSLATLVKNDPVLTWDVPAEWSLEEAATVPIVYATVIFALKEQGHLQRGDSVLIHAGSGGVGQAAINYCLHHGCTVFTTVGTPEKRDFIKKRFPQLTDQHIGNSRDTTFEELVKIMTRGRGVDLVLNSLSEEKLLASVRCLAKGGRFLEIGKFDISRNSILGKDTFSGRRSFHSVMLDVFFTASPKQRQQLHNILVQGIQEGSVQPLVRTVFSAQEVEQAFRFMAAGKHIGKVLVRMRDEEDQQVIVPRPITLLARPRFNCSPDGMYIIIGGLGGFGLELADWLVLRGARKLLLGSRTGIRTGYQSSRVRIWRSYGTAVHISTADISTASGVEALLNEANAIGSVIGIFNLAVVLLDALLENQTEERFQDSANIKALATRYLDVLSRHMCPFLEHFVVFSSVSCGRGNAGQTNYGMANSVMERVCEARVRDGLPGLAVQWGAVGEVGLVAEMQEEQHELVIGGTLQQRIGSCLEVLDSFMVQPQPVVASMVVAEKRAGSSSSANIVDCITNILGLRDLKTISTHSTLAELGMDSMMAVEIKQALEREYELFLTPQDIRSMTFAHLQEMAAADKDGGSKPFASTDVQANAQETRQYLVHAIGDEASTSIPVLPLPSLCFASSAPVLFLVPGIEGMANLLEPLSRKVTVQCLGLQLGYNCTATDISGMAQYLLKHMKLHLAQGVPFNLVGHSLGGLLALEMALLLEAEGQHGTVVLLDSAPDIIPLMVHGRLLHGDQTEDSVQVKLLGHLLGVVSPTTDSIRSKFEAELHQLDTWEKRVSLLISASPESHHSEQHKRAVVEAMLIRTRAVLEYHWPARRKVLSLVSLIRPTNIPLVNVEENYGLAKYCKQRVEVHLVEGDHISMLDNPITADIINRFVSSLPATSNEQFITNLTSAARDVNGEREK